MVALALPLIAIGAGLQSCSEDGPGIPSEDAIEETTQVKNLLMRSPEEAIDIAQRAWEDMFHYNWGWNGAFNGWFHSLQPVANEKLGYGYRDLRFKGCETVVE